LIRTAKPFAKKVFYPSGNWNGPDRGAIINLKPGLEVTAPMNVKGFDIAKNMRIIENLKSELLFCVSHLYRQMTSDRCEDIRETALDALSDTIIISYLLSRRLGLEYTALEKEISSKIRLGLVEGHDTEKYFGDISALARLRNPQAST
jgi:hypothetical protein